MKFNKNLLNTPWIAYTIATCSAVVLFVLLTHLDVIGGALRGLGTLVSPIVTAAIIAGDELSGVSIIKMGMGMDDGPILMRQIEPMRFTKRAK